MPRTPLFRALQRSFRLARLAVETGRPADEVAEIVRESSGLTRRQLLGGTAAAAGLALVGWMKAEHDEAEPARSTRRRRA